MRLQNMRWLYLRIWDWDLIFGRAVKVISSPGVRSPCPGQLEWLDRYAMLEIETVKTAIDYSIHTYATIAIFSVFCFLFKARQSDYGDAKTAKIGKFS